MVTREELAAFLQARGWYLDMVEKRGKGKLYAYAKRRVGEKVLTRYLIAESKLEELTEDRVESRLYF